ncbi:MAG: hypothetical protein NT123_01375 [Proteobacteria bacterium]|nr:hypothetical protein [Pseudomonadota bacterium]
MPSSIVTAADPGTERHAPHEDRQHQGLRVGGVPEEELEVMAPDGFVDQPGESGQGEQQEQRAAGVQMFEHGGYSDAWMRRRRLRGAQNGGSLAQESRSVCRFAM